MTNPPYTRFDNSSRLAFELLARLVRWLQVTLEGVQFVTPTGAPRGSVWGPGSRRRIFPAGYRKWVTLNHSALASTLPFRFTAHLGRGCV